MWDNPLLSFVLDLLVISFSRLFDLLFRLGLNVSFTPGSGVLSHILSHFPNPRSKYQYRYKTSQQNTFGVFPPTRSLPINFSRHIGNKTFPTKDKTDIPSFGLPPIVPSPIFLTLEGNVVPGPLHQNSKETPGEPVLPQKSQ